MTILIRITGDDSEPREITVEPGQAISIAAGDRVELPELDLEELALLVDGDDLTITLADGQEFTLVDAVAAVDSDNPAQIVFGDGDAGDVIASIDALLDAVAAAAGAAGEGTPQGGTLRADGDIDLDGLGGGHVGARGPGDGVPGSEVDPFGLDPSFGGPRFGSGDEGDEDGPFFTAGPPPLTSASNDFGGAAFSDFSSPGFQGPGGPGDGPGDEPGDEPGDGPGFMAANLQTSTSADGQVIKVTVTGSPTVDDEVELDGTAFEENLLDFNDTLTFDPDNDYTITVEYESGGNQTHVKGLTILDENGEVAFEINPFGNDNDLDFSIGDIGNTYDGGIYLLDPTADPDDFAWDVTGPIGYTFDGTTLALDTAASQNGSFDLDLEDLVIDTFEGVDVIDISGNINGGNSDNEDNSITINVQDVIDITDDTGAANDALTILGDAPKNAKDVGGGDSVTLVDEDGAGGDEWTSTSNAGFDTWSYSGSSVTVIIEDSLDVTVLV